MINGGLTLLGRFASTAAFGAIAAKLVDTLVFSKLNNKSEQKKWLRQAKLEAYAKLSQEILSLDLENIEKDIKRKIKEHGSKSILLLDDRILIKRIEEYLQDLEVLDSSQNKTKESILLVDKKGINLVRHLNKNLKKV